MWKERFTLEKHGARHDGGVRFERDATMVEAHIALRRDSGGDWRDRDEVDVLSVYQAAAWLRIADAPPYIAFEAREDSRRFLKTQMELIRSPLVLGPVVSQPEIAQLHDLRDQEAPIDWLAKKVRANPVGGSELFEISFESRYPDEAAKLVTAIVNIFFQAP